MASSLTALRALVYFCCFVAATVLLRGAEPSHSPVNFRRPASEGELRFWLENMAVHHRYTTEEIAAATGLSDTEIQEAIKRFKLESQSATIPKKGEVVRILPYPGGRHPRIGFLEGAIDPQRETKFSAFTPWDAHSYVVVDCPEAIFSNLGLTYLAHTHIPTIWTKANVELPPLEWKRLEGQKLALERKLPNGISFASRISPLTNGVLMELSLFNGTVSTLTDLRVQNCVMLKAAHGFNAQTNANKIFAKPYVAVRSAEGNKWIITAWQPCHRAWANPPVPCLHSDPKFPDCPSGETRIVRGILSFYEGTDVEEEFKRLNASGWDQPEN